MTKRKSTKRTDVAVLLKEKRAEYGQEILQSLIAKLASEFGRGLGKQSLFRIVRFSVVFPDPKIVSALLRQFVSSFTVRLTTEGGD
jgi:hypothetical protein